MAEEKKVSSQQAATEVAESSDFAAPTGRRKRFQLRLKPWQNSYSRILPSFPKMQLSLSRP